jgi:acetylornithine deacetylase/succinyl-diaminopimelate desuccinylase-like protein
MSPNTAAAAAAANRRITTLAADRAIHRAFAWLHLHEPQLRRWQLEFLAIPAPPFGESARAAWFLERFHDLGLQNPHLDEAGNALAELNPSSSIPYSLLPTPCLLLSAHLDTVFPPGTDCTPHEDGPQILGPGATDNGAGLAALLALAAALRHAEITPATTILFCANVGEEGPGDLRGMRHLFQTGPYRDRIRAAIALEGSGDATVVDRALGSRRLRITVTGPGGHSWADAGQPNPIFALATALAALAKLKLPANPRTTLSCGLIAGGTSVNSIPESATADLDLRSVSALELDRTELAVLNTLTQTLGALSSPPPLAAKVGSTEPSDLHFHVTRTGDRPSGALAPTAPLSISLRAVDRHLLLATDSRIGSTDANLPLSLGIPALAIGCGGTGWGLHTLQEGYDPTGRELALRRILLLLLDACHLTQPPE